MLKLLCLLPLMLPLLWSCSDRYTPWETDVPDEYTQLTNRNLQSLAELPEAQLPIKIALVGDPQGTPIDLERVVASINHRDDIRMILLLGDLTDYGLLHEYIWAAKALMAARVPHLTVIGNHDAIAHGKKIYQKMYGAFDYTFTDAGFKFVMFNDNQFEFGETDFNWLKQEVNSNAIVASHVPPAVDMHRPEQIKVWTDINAAAGVVASLHGHRGNQNDFKWVVGDVPYYVAPKVTGVYYSIMTIDENRKVSFELCKPECGVEP